jgi:solute carrier family 8 (sodium/calcium exchanger)
MAFKIKPVLTPR